MAAGNSVWDEVKEQRRKLKGRPFREKLSWFWEYYKIHTLVVLFLVWAGGSMIFHAVTAKHPALEAAFVNVSLASGIDSAQFSEDFLSYTGMNPRKYEPVFFWDMNIDYDSADDISYANFQKLTANMAAGALDVLVCDQECFDRNAGDGVFADLTQILPDDLLKDYADRLVYRDLPDDDAGEIAVAVDLSGSSLFADGRSPTLFTVLSNTSRPETAAMFLRFIKDPEG